MEEEELNKKLSGYLMRRLACQECDREEFGGKIQKLGKVGQTRVIVKCNWIS